MSGTSKSTKSNLVAKTKDDPFATLKLTPTADKEAHVEPVKYIASSGRYDAKNLARPRFVHDGGFIERYGRREATSADQRSKMMWLAKLAAAEALCGPKTGEINPACDYEDQTDAVAAYRYYWEGKGKDRHAINYEHYLRDDPSATDLVNKIVDDFITHMEIIGKNRTNFHVVSRMYSIGDGGFAKYPSTVNWQRTIGAHILWVSATVTASVKHGEIQYAADMMIHMEDRYNFNPGGVDIASKTIKDEENGAFERIGWAFPYMNYASVARQILWTEKLGKSRIIKVLPVPPPELIINSAWE